MNAEAEIGRDEANGDFNEVFNLGIHISPKASERMLIGVGEIAVHPFAVWLHDGKLKNALCRCIFGSVGTD